MSYQGNNPEGYPDPTANQAVGIVSREEKEAAKAKNLELSWRRLGRRQSLRRYESAGQKGCKGSIRILYRNSRH